MLLTGPPRPVVASLGRARQDQTLLPRPPRSLPPPQASRMCMRVCVCVCVSHTRASLTLFTPSLLFFLILLWHFSFKQKIKTFPMATTLKASLAFLPLSHPNPCQSISRLSRKSKTNPQRSSLTGPPPSRVPPLSLPVLVCPTPTHMHARTHILSAAAGSLLRTF